MGLKSSYKLLCDTEAFLTSLEDEISRAKSTIDLQFYSFEADTIGKRAVEALFKARSRGIHVRFIIDHFSDLSHNDRYIRKPRLNRSLRRSIISEWQETKKLIARMKEEGIEIKRTNPLGFLFRKALIRDHKKIVVIDSNIFSKAVAYIGGINLCEHNALWNDFMVRMRGDMIPIIQADFNSTWEDKNKEGAVSKYSDGVVLTDARKSARIMPYLRDLIDTAKKFVIMESPYLYGKEIKQCLINAAQRGVDVSVIVPLHNNKKFFAPSGKFLKHLIEYGVHIYQFEANKGMTHAKALLVDDLAVFGSSNYNGFLSGRTNEINIVTENKDMLKQLKEKLDQDIKSSRTKFTPPPSFLSFAHWLRVLLNRN